MKDNLLMDVNKERVLLNGQIGRFIVENLMPIELKVRVDKTFTPASQGDSRDTRELGVRVYQLYLGRASD